VTDRSSGDDRLSLFHHALRAARRRHVITILRYSTEKPLTVRRLSRKVTAEENDASLEHATGEPYRNVYNSLSQTHLPTLDDVDIVNYDSDRQTVTTGSRFTTAALLLELTRSTSDILEGDIGGNSDEG
jgi:hypothetical protein